ncbi:MAG: hypothetical protein ACYC0X_03335 [Pirellulaceae bacterium]
MEVQQNAGVVSYEHRFHVTRRRIKQLVNVLHQHERANGDFGDIGDLLRSLPLASDQYALASRRLSNASRYLTAGERGAAEYELRLLEGSLLLPACPRWELGLESGW